MIEKNGGILLTKEEYSDYLQLQENYRLALENIDRLQMLLGKLQDKYIRFFKKRDEIRKETAKEILQEIASPYYSVGDVYELTRHDIQELAEKFGAEVSDE